MLYTLIRGSYQINFGSQESGFFKITFGDQ